MKNETKSYRSKLVALLLLVFLGGVGAHNFYLGRKDVALTQLILTLVGMLTIWIFIGLIPLMVVWVWVVVDLILILLAPTDKNFDWHF